MIKKEGSQMFVNTNYSRFKVAAIQASPVVRDAPDWFDLKSTLDKATSLIFEASRNGARLIVFPETWLPCYPYWSFDFTDRATFRDLWAAYLWNSIEVPSGETEALGEAAKKANAYVAIGINERDKNFQGRMYNSILYLNPNGEVMGTHRKICNTHVERIFHTPGNGGDNLKAVYKTDIGYIGGSICGEHSQLTLIYNWIMQGIQIHCSLWPGTATTKVQSDICTRAVCWAAHTFGIMSATYFREQDLPRNFYKNSAFNNPGMLSGGSGVISPFGTYITGPVYDEETIVYGDIDLSDIDKARYAVNLTGIYSRWDLLSLNVRQEAYEPFVPMKTGEEESPSSASDRITELESRINRLEQQIISFLPEKCEETHENG
jgi:nitrilase